ncbi:MAG: hypothetical protein WCQ21_13810 [Verrucomicrobiota bacterium]|jgi:hypothetical protein
MKTPLQIAVVLLMMTSGYAWIHPIPDYRKQLEASDLVAVVRVAQVSNTGITKQLRSNSRLQFRELEVQLEVISPMKGEAPQHIRCRLYRFPTIKETMADLGEREARVEDLKASPWESGLFVPKQWEYYLGYLKRSDDAHYVPVGGFESAALGFLALKAPFTTRPDGTAEPGGAANESQPIRSETNQTSSAAGSRR